MGAVERRLAAPAVVGRLGLVLDTDSERSGFGFTTDGRTDETGLPPLNPPGSSNRKPQRNSDFDFRFFAVSIKAQAFALYGPQEWPNLSAAMYIDDARGDETELAPQ